MSTDIEQLFHELEQRYASLRKESDVLAADRDSWKEKYNAGQSSSTDMKIAIDNLNKKLSQYESEIAKKDTSIQSLEKSSESANFKYIQKSEEVDRLRSEMKMNVDELTMLQDRIKELQSTSTDSQNQLLPLQYELSRCQQDKSFLEDRLKSCESDLQARMRSLADEKSTSSKLKYDLDSKVGELQSELDMTKDRLKSSQDQVSILQEKSSSYQQKIRSLEEDIAKQYEVFFQESEGLRRLNDLQKRHLAEANDMVVELESNLQTSKESHSRQQAKIRDEAIKRIESVEEQASRHQRELEDKIKELESIIASHDPSSNAKNIIAMIAEEEDAGKHIASLKQSYGTDIYTLYDRILILEKEKIAEHDRRQEVEIYLQHVVKDIDQKAPIIAEQKRNYTRLLQAHESMSKRYDELVNQNNLLQSKVSKLEQLKNDAVNECQVINQHNKDLSKQVQHMLKRSMEMQQGRTPKKSTSLAGHDSSSALTGDAIGDFLVAYDDVEELQLRNTQLLQTIRKLEKDMEDSNHHAEERASEAANTAINVAMKEITALREQRQHTEELVDSLAQQRDMYKAMVQESGILTIGSNDHSQMMMVPVGDIQTPQTPKTPGAGMMILNHPHSNNATPNRNIQELQYKLSASEEEKMKLKDRLARLEEAEKLLHEALTSLRQETSKLRMEAAMNASEAKFNKDRASQLEDAMKMMTSENHVSMQRRLDIEKLLIEQQHATRLKDDQIRQLHEQLHTSQERIHQVEMEIEVSHSSEQRLQEQLSLLREEMKRAASLSESVHRIELGLSNQVTEEKQSLINERDRANSTIESLRHQVTELSHHQVENSTRLKQQLESIEASLHERMKECDTLKEDLSRERIIASSAMERSQLLEKQLSLTQERLFASQGVHVMETLSEQQLTETQLALDQAHAQITSLQHQVKLAESHGDEYRKLSSSTGTTLQELQHIMASSKATYEQEIQQLNETISSLQEEAHHQNTSTGTLVQDIEVAREEIRSLKQTLQDREQHESSILEHAKQAQLQFDAQIDQLKADVVKFQQVAKSAHMNYERELTLHATAERELRDVHQQVEEYKVSLQLAEEKLSSYSADMIRKEASYNEQRTRYETNINELNHRITELSHINDSLHHQVHSLSQQVDKMLSSRGQASTENIKSASSDAPSVDAPATSSNVDASIISELQSTVSELREVIRYMKRERDLLSAKLSLAEAESNRHMTALSTSYRNIDELRLQLTSMKESKLKDGNMMMIAIDEVTRMQHDSQQYMLLRDSNSHLRQANDELMSKLTMAENELQRIRTAIQPLEEKIQHLSSEKSALEQTQKQDAADATYWRDRLQQLVTRYHEIDPEEHRVLKESAATSSSTIKSLESSIEALKSDITSLKASEVTSKASYDAKVAEMQQLQNTFETAEKNSNTLRAKLRELKTKYDEMAAKFVAKTKVEVDLKKQVATLTEQISQNVSTSSISASAPAVAASAVEVVMTETTTTSTVIEPVPITTSTATAVVPSRKRPLEPEPAAPATSSEEPVSRVEASSTTTTSSTLTAAAVVVPSEESKAMDETSTTATNPSTAESKLQKMRETLLLKRAMEKGTTSSTSKPTATSTSASSNVDASAPISSPPVEVDASQPDIVTSSNVAVEVPALKKTKIDDGDVEEEDSMEVAETPAEDATAMMDESVPESISPVPAAMEEEVKAVVPAQSPIPTPAFVEPTVFPSSSTSFFGQQPSTSSFGSKTGSIFGFGSSPSPSTTTSSLPTSGGIFGSAFTHGFGSASPSTTNAFGSLASQSSQLPFGSGSGIFGKKTSISEPAAKIEPMHEDEPEEGEERGMELPDDWAQVVIPSPTPFLNLRPPSPSLGANTGTIPKFGSSKGSLPIPALLTAPSTASSSSTSSLFRRPGMPAEGNIFTSTSTPTSIGLPISTPISSEPATSVVQSTPVTSSVEPVEHGSASKSVTQEASPEAAARPTPVKRLTGPGNRPLAKKSPKATDPVTMAQKKELRAQRFNEAAAGGSEEAVEGESAAATSPPVIKPKVLKPKAKSQLGNLVKSQLSKPKPTAPSTDVGGEATSSSSGEASKHDDASSGEGGGDAEE